MASNNHPAAGDSRPEYDGSRTVTYGIVNGVFIRKVPKTVTVYPEITDQISNSFVLWSMPMNWELEGA